MPGPTSTTFAGCQYHNRFSGNGEEEWDWEVRVFVDRPRDIPPMEKDFEDHKSFIIKLIEYWKVSAVIGDHNAEEILFPDSDSCTVFSTASTLYIIVSYLYHHY